MTYELLLVFLLAQHFRCHKSRNFRIEQFIALRDAGHISEACEACNLEYEDDNVLNGFREAEILRGPTTLLLISMG